MSSSGFIIPSTTCYISNSKSCAQNVSVTSNVWIVEVVLFNVVIAPVAAVNSVLTVRFLGTVSVPLAVS